MPNSITTVQVCDATGVASCTSARIPKISTLLFAVACCLMATINVHGQQLNYAQTKEKVYVHTNHVFFKQGETVFYKVYVTDAATLLPTRISNKVTVVIINPAGNVISQTQNTVTQGFAEGSFDFTQNLPGGIYKLKAYTNWMQNETDSTWFTKELTLQKVITPRILMKLDFAEKGYGAADTVKASFAMRSLTDAPIKSHQVNYTVSLAGKNYSKGNFSTNMDGKATIAFVLPDTLNTSDGLLNITVSYDGYTEAISRKIPIVLNDIDLQFMPEGGTLIHSLPTNIAFKAVNEFGKAADVKGVIKDEAGNVVTSFNSYHFGMGRFGFTPLNGHVYTAYVTSPANISKAYPLPVCKPYGVVMNVKTDSNSVQVRLQATGDMEVLLKLTSHNKDYYTQTLTITKATEVTIPIEKLPAGIAVISISNNGGTPLAERLAFLHREKRLQIKLSTDKPKYQPREKVEVQLQTMDGHGNPIPANLSVAVVNDQLWTMADDKQDDIRSWLLMSCELKGKIEEPAFYFKEDEAKALNALDLVMLTHGYRYFEYIPYVRQNNQLLYMPDESGSVSGVLIDKDGKPVTGEVFLLDETWGGKAGRFTTIEDGVFYFTGLLNGTHYRLIAKSKKPNQEVAIRVLQSNTETYTAVNGLQARPGLREDIRQVAVANAKLALPELQRLAAVRKDAVNFGNEEIQDVVVMAYGSVKKKSMTGAVATVEADKILAAPGIEQALQGRIAGIQVTNANGVPGSSPQILIRGIASNPGSTPLYVIDGVPVEPAAINSLNVSNIQSVEVLKDASAMAIYGARSANGVILINTIRQPYNHFRTLEFTPKNYYATQTVVTGGASPQPIRRFYAPVYTSTETPQRNDFRETIYWNSIVETGEDGKASFSFYNSDATTTFRVLAEGIDSKGQPGHNEYTYSVQNALSVDIKTPPYLTVDDTTLLPVVVKNNTLQPQSFNINVRLPKAFMIGEFTGSFTLQPDSTYRLWIPVRATQPATGELELYVTAQGYRERIVTGISAAGKGFPFAYTLSGNDNTQHNLNLPEYITGSLQTKVEVFDRIEGQLLNGIESMLREPYGCFEQTSSTTYPNVYILKYLKSVNNTNPDIEAKALKYIRAGYNRLTGFETRLHGFEWFGNTPPHEALTAYGLLEFTDMKPFIAVDEAMLTRTKNFLLSRKDGYGGFQLASGGYDKFASVPNRIADVYIVYALTQAGIGIEIKKEYDSTFNRALRSKDIYQMAMMALAASNLKQQKDYDKLMAALKAAYQQNRWQAQTSVVNSSGKSLSVETDALYALVLMRSPTVQIGDVAACMGRILQNKQYYGYGSTQATVLALQAVLEYGKLISSLPRNTQVGFVSNGKAITAKSLDNLVQGNNLIQVSYPNVEGEKVPYSIEVTGQTFTPPSDTNATMHLYTALAETQATIGQTVRMSVKATNTQNKLQPMVTAKIGIPAGLSMQPWQLKTLMEEKKVAYYEIFDNYLVLYWMGFAANETKTIHLDLKVDIPGSYRAKAGCIYLYYTPEHKHWCQGEKITITP